MTKRKKLYQRILNKPKDLRFDELEKLILSCGYRLNRIRGSHAIYTKPDSETLTIPRKSPVKSYLIDYVLTMLGDCFDDEI